MKYVYHFLEGDRVPPLYAGAHRHQMAPPVVAPFLFVPLEIPRSDSHHTDGP
jgi:hypothetical protein